ncbi:MAG: hypothetical protein K5896_12250 [Prevotella sp.]|nr:hypothetical protein [Prevotella sp.]
MKRILIMLLIACSAITTASADSTATPQKKAKSVIQSLEGIIAFYAKEGSETTSVTKNPETGLIESSVRIVPFTCKKEDLWAISIGFRADEPLSYQYMHLQPGSTELFDLKVVTNNGQKSKNVRIRINTKQEMWFMCCKNPDNPQLRDAYAIVWEETKDNHVAGTVFMITSLRPDMYEKNMSSAGLISDNQNTFTIDGRVGYDLKDSLYVVYMADSAEELDNVADDAYVATMPVVNKRFSFSVQLDKPKAGRIRTVMPDGSLCELWTNLDFVPGETYRITTHNGYYDEDRDYERRVGRQSGHSLLVNNSPTVFEADMVAIDPIPGQDTLEDELKRWEKTLTPQQHAMIELKAQNVQTAKDVLKGIYNQAEENSGAGTFYIDIVSEQIISQTKVLDSNIQDFAKDLKAYGMPSAGLMDIYKTILNSYSEQNKKLSALLIAAPGSKKAKKAQKLVQDLMEKYMKEATRIMDSDVADTSKK